MFKFSFKIFLIFVCLSRFLLIKPIFSQTLSKGGQMGQAHIRGQLTFDIYKPFGSVYLGLERPKIMEAGQERKIYSELAKRLFLPKYILLQATFYPLAAWSSHWETSHYELFRRFKIYEGINGLRAIGSGFEEPYALSVLLGNIVRLAYYDKESLAKNAGSSLAGFLFSGSNHFIYDNIYLIGRWYQAELMLIGDSRSPQQRRSWNFRIGAKLYKDSFISNALTISLERNSTDYSGTGFSLLKNSIFKYQAKFSLQNEKEKTPATFQMVNFAKKIPLKIFGRRAFFVIGSGVKWEWIRRYDHAAGSFEESPSSQLVWLFTPNVEF